MPAASLPTRRPLPLILIRGFGGLAVEDEKQLAYQGFNVGTVYPRKRGENYIFEGFILRFMKSDWEYHDATNVVNYFAQPLTQQPALPPELAGFDPGFFGGHKVVIDAAMAAHLRRAMLGEGGLAGPPRPMDPHRTLWVFRYYDLNDRAFKVYGEALVRLIDFIRALAQKEGEEAPPVNIIAHSMGGLIAREAIQRTYPQQKREAAAFINKLVTLGTPHQGISFQVLKEWIAVDAEDELEHFAPDFQKDGKRPEAFVNFHKHFPLERLLTVVGTNYRSYGVRPASWLNRLFAVSGEFGPNYNRSDGLVKQASAQIPGAPRTFVHKCHGGPDSLVTARESYEVATRFLFGDVFVRLRLVEAEVLRGLDRFGKSEVFFGLGIKPRGVDFELFHQSAEAENCYGPFASPRLDDKKVAFPWAGPGRLIWEGWLDTSKIVGEAGNPRNVVLRLDFYVGERDLFGIGFSDNVIFRKQYYAQAVLDPELTLYAYADEDFQQAHFRPHHARRMRREGKGWRFDVKGTGFEATLEVEILTVPEAGPPKPYGR